MAQGPPEGTITSLPVRKGKGAPDTFKGDYRDIEPFLDHFEALCAEKNVSKDEYKCRGLLRYCSREVRETLEGLKSYSDKNYKDFQADFIYHYDKDRERQRYKVKDLHSLVRKWQEKKVGNLETFKKYHLKYLKIGGWLLKHHKITDAEHRKWFWAGLHKRFRRKVEGQMRITEPNLDIRNPFQIEKIVKAARRVYDRERFDDDELTLYVGRSDRGSSASESDSESESSSSSSSESSEEEDSDTDSEEEKSYRRKHRKRKVEKKKRESKEKRSGESKRSGKNADDEIDELVEKMIGLDISEPKYLAMWVKLIRLAPEMEKVFQRPESQRVDHARRDFRTRQPPPHLNSNMIDRDGPPRGYGMKCFGCGQMGHSASRCEEINRFVQEGLLERNGYGKVQWKGGAPILREGEETLVEAIRRGTKQANLIMVAHAERWTNPKQTYLNIERYDSDADTDEQEEMWLSSMGSDVFEAEAYGVQRTEKVSRGIRGATRETNLQVKADRTERPTRGSKLVDGGIDKRPANPHLGGNVTNRRDRAFDKTPVDVHPLGTNTDLLIRYMSSKLQTNGKKTSPVITLQMLGFFRIY